MGCKDLESDYDRAECYLGCCGSIRYEFVFTINDPVPYVDTAVQREDGTVFTGEFDSYPSWAEFYQDIFIDWGEVRDFKFLGGEECEGCEDDPDDDDPDDDGPGGCDGLFLPSGACDCCAIAERLLDNLQNPIY